MSWIDWDYRRWNEELLWHHFKATPGLAKEPVERLAATPDELRVVAHDPTADGAAIAETFVDLIRRELPYRHRTLCSYSLEYEGWNPESARSPHFFAMLWFTCLVAWGYPDSSLRFDQRIEQALGKKDGLRDLPRLWADLSSWTARRCAAGHGIRELLLPPDVGLRTVIGNSWFLAFPHKADRNELALCLSRAGLVGFEPPIQPVVRALRLSADRFSPEFQEDFDDFVRALASGADPKASAFWRAVRQEALEPSVGEERLDERTTRGSRCGLLVWDTDEGLRPMVCGPEESQPPPGYERQDLEDPVGRFVWYATAADGDLTEPGEQALNRGELVGLRYVTLARQGVLLLREEMTGVYCVVTGSEAHGASLALVKEDLAAAFCRAYGGRSDSALVGGWVEVADCQVAIGPSLPAGLEDVLQLLPTMQPRGVSLVGGIRVPGGFLRFNDYLPRVHARGADSVSVQREGQDAVACRRCDFGQDEWALPESVVPATGTVQIEAIWSSTGTFGEARASARVEFVDRTMSDEYRNLPAGDYLAESCLGPETDIHGPADVRLEFTGDQAGSADLLPLDTTARYLGPGEGQMSRQPRPGFDWLVAGSLGTPDVLAYVGDPTSPTPPANTRSPSKGDRRHWRKALKQSRSMVVRHADGKYSDLRDHPALDRARAALCYRRSPTAPECEVSHLQLPHATHIDDTTAVSVATEAMEALGALSVRRSGLQYGDLRSLLTPLVGSNPLAIQQLLRSLEECGLVDVVRAARRGTLTICARRPSLVLFRRGPVVEATVYGLVCQTREELLQAALQRHGEVSHERIMPPNHLQPSGYRLRGTEGSVVAVATEAGIKQSAWLTWPDANTVPAAMDVTDAYRRLRSDPPPSQYAFNASWDWTVRSFRRDRNIPRVRRVAIERRLHPIGSSIYVVLLDETPACWTRVRNWALLFGHELAGLRPFAREQDGTLSCAGLSPVHLPLPIARLCGIIGAGLPGPVLIDGQVSAYRYPFGTRLYALVSAVVPPSWIRDGAGA